MSSSMSHSHSQIRGRPEPERLTQQGEEGDGILTRLVFLGITGCSRPLASLARLAGLTTQRTLELFWPFHAVLRRLRITRRVVRAQGARFFYDSPDLISLKLALIGAHEYDVTAFLAKTLHAGDNFVDVGANIGYHTILAAQRVKSGRVVAVEPSERNRSALKANVFLNGLDNVAVIDRAAWSASGLRLSLHIRDSFNCGANSLLEGGAVECEVETICVDDIVRTLELERVDCVKIDVEGSELEVLRGMRAVLRASPPPRIVCALDHPDHSNRLASRQLLASAGYRAMSISTEQPLPDGDAPHAGVLFAHGRQPSF
jgi:FkbM family methyltransferase